MADDLLKKNLTLLREGLQLQEIDFELLSNDVITQAEFQNVTAQSREHGSLQGNRTLLTFLLQKSTGQKKKFFECLQREQSALWSRLEHSVYRDQVDGLVCQESGEAELQVLPSGSRLAYTPAASATSAAPAVSGVGPNALTEKVVSRIATEIAPDWEDVAYELGMSHTEVTSIRKNSRAVQEMAREMLFALRAKSPTLAKSDLIEALLTLNKRLVADKIERIFSAG